MLRSAISFSLLLASVFPAAAATCDDTAPVDPGVSCGNGAFAGHASNVAVGDDAQLVPVTTNGAPVDPVNATAVGSYSRADAGSTAIGAFARALNVDSAAFGRSALAIGAASTAIGSNANALGDRSLAIGRMATVESSGHGGIAIGYAARSDGGIVIGDQASATGGATLALGSFAQAQGLRATAIGLQSKATAEGASAFGMGAEATANAGSAFGALARATGANSVAVGYGSEAVDAATVSFGTSTFTRRLVNVSAGLADADGVNLGQLRSLAPGFGGGATIVNGMFVNPTYNLSGGAFSNVGDALTYLDNRVTNIATTPGPQGPSGPQGPQGPQGPKGPAGQDGSGGGGCGEAVCYDDTSRRTATLNKGGSSTRITNVSAGVGASDAVNVSQLDAGINRAVSTSNAYTDQRISQLRGDMWEVDRNARGGIAAAMAIAGLPQAYAPGGRMAAFAGSSYRGEAGLAVGVSGISDNGKWLYKVSGSGNTTGDFGMTVGAGIQW